MNEGSGKGEEVREVCVQYLYLVGESSTRGNARNDGGGVLFFLFSLPQPNKLDHNKDTTSLAG